jgi:Fe-S-cluster-containing hydrogenase component 2/CRP-like cAMP-binding protein
VSDVTRQRELISLHEKRMKLVAPATVEDLRGLPLFAGIPEKARDVTLKKLAEKKYVFWIRYAKGEDVLRLGDYNDSAFYIVEGVVEVILEGLGSGGPARATAQTRRQAAGGQRSMAGAAAGSPAAATMIGRGGTSGTVILSAFPAAVTAGRRTLLEQGDIFGELSALSRYAVSATVRAETDVKLLQLKLPGLRMVRQTSKEFKKTLDESYRERSLGQHLRRVGILEGVDQATIGRLQAQAELLSFDPGNLIVEQGTPADAFYLVRGGFVKVSVRAGSSDLAMTYLRKGDYVGESALLVEDFWPFNLHALDHVELVKIKKEDFKGILARTPAIEDQLWRQMLDRLKLRGSVMRDPTSAEYTQMAMETGLIHGESVLLIDLSTCTRCDECVRGCADAHGGQPRFIREGERYRSWLIPTACYQCTDPTCMMNCPTGAITRDIGGLEVTINEATCIGCTNCAKQCPWGNITMVEYGKPRDDGVKEFATKCDLCLGRSQGPACVQMCPHGSAIRVNFQDIARVTETLK